MAYDLHAVFLLVDANLRAKPSLHLSDLEGALSIGRHTLSRAIKMHTGLSFRQLRSSLMLTHIGRCLAANPACTLKQVSYDAGYSSQRSLSRFVKAQVGISPKRYRLQPVGRPSC